MHTDSVKSTTHYSQFAPTRILTPFVACYWTITGADENPATRIRVLPDGCMDIIFDFIGSIRLAEPPQDTNYTSFMVGIHETSMVEPLQAAPKMLGIRFRPGAVTSLLGFSAPEFSESHVDLDGVLPDFSRLVFSYAGDMNTPRKMVAVLERLLLERLGSLPDSHALTRQFETECLDDVWKDIEARCADIIHPIREAPWGQRGFRLRDPDGYVVEVSKSLKVLFMRLLDMGMMPEKVAERVGVPLEMVNGMTK